MRNYRSAITRSTWFLLLAGVAFQISAGPPAPPVQLFDVIKKPERIDPQWRAALCKLLPQPCEEESLQLLRPRATAADAYILLSKYPLAMARVNYLGRAYWKLESLHDFRGYRHSMEDQKPDIGGLELQPLSLAPALYPLASGRWAVAVLWAVAANFSGGSAFYSKADFVPIGKPTSADGLTHAGVPFSCYTMVRACFSENEHKTSPHCHEENSGDLRITYSAPANPGGNYGWSYIWRQSDWPAHVSAGATRTSVTRFADGESSAAPFCGGLQ